MPLGLPGTVERGRDVFALPVEYFPALLGGLCRAIARFPGAPVDKRARLGPGGRRKEQRHGGSHGRAGDEREEYRAPADALSAVT